MHIYRVVPNSIAIRENSHIALKGNAFSGAEDLYYNMGYTSFIKGSNSSRKNWNRAINTLNTEGQGKFFFIFPDDAIKHSFEVINSFGRKIGCTYSLLVYNIPSNIVLNNIGYGIYGEDGDIHLAEVYITKDQFGKTVIDSSSIDEQRILTELINILKTTLSKEANTYLQHDSPTIFEYMEDLDDFNLIQHLEDEEYIKKLVETSKLYNSLKEYNGQIIKSDFIIDKNISINSYENAYCFCHNGLDVQGLFEKYDFSPELYTEQEKREIVGLLEEGEENKAKIKSLIKE